MLSVFQNNLHFIIGFNSFNHSLMRDSKKLNERTRLIAFDYIKEYAIDWVIHYKDENYIDKHNIFAAN